MYIKIKHIKQFLLAAACLFFAFFNYFTYVNASDAQSDSPVACDKLTDSDCDELTDAEEKLYGTDPNNADTDGDGYSDGVEVKSGYDPLKPAPGDRITTGADTTTPISTTDQIANTSISGGTQTLTDTLSQDLQTYIASKGDTPISTTDIQDVTTASLAAKTGAPITWDTLPEIDRSKIKILSQPYATLTDAASKTKMQDDANAYIIKVLYLALSNSPKPIMSIDDATSFADDFQTHLSSLSTLTPDIAYFSDLGSRADLFLQQIDNIEVPESMLDMHIKVLRLLKGALALKDLSSPTQDPVASMIILSKVQDFAGLVTDFLTNDIMNYANRMGTT